MEVGTSSGSSSPCSRISAPSRSSPGSDRWRLTSPAMYVRDPAIAAWRSSTLAVKSASILVRCWKSARSAYGTPISSQITSDGTGSANVCTKSRGAPSRSIASRRSVTMDSIRGRSRCMDPERPDGRIAPAHRCFGAQPGEVGDRIEQGSSHVKWSARARPIGRLLSMLLSVLLAVGYQATGSRSTPYTAEKERNGTSSNGIARRNPGNRRSSAG
jgi:hypothetical protein